MFHVSSVLSLNASCPSLIAYDQICQIKVSFCNVIGYDQLSGDVSCKSFRVSSCLGDILTCLLVASGSSVE